MSYKISDLDRIMNCAGSVDLIQDNPTQLLQYDRTDADAGTRAHAVGASLLRDGSLPNNDPCFDDDEMMHAVTMFVDDVREIEKLTGKRAIVEGEVIAGQVNRALKGKPDAYLFDREANALYIWEFKYGHGRVDAIRNWQLIGEAAGALYGTNSNNDTVVIMRIVQPRCFHATGPIREWIQTACELLQYFNQIAEQLETIRANEVNLCSVSSACKRCPVAHLCEALHVAGDYAADIAYENLTFDLDNDCLGRELRLLKAAHKLLEHRIEALQTDAEHRLTIGERVLGFHLEGGLGRSQWKHDIKTMIGMGRLMGVDLSKPAIVTPAQAKKLDIDPDLVDSWSERPRLEPKIKPDDSNIYSIFRHE